MLGKGRAVELMDAIGAQVRKLIEPGAPAPDAIRLERVADAIVSIEYYMETLQSGRTDPWYMLDNAEICIKTLADEAPSRVPNIGISASDAAKTVKLDPAETIALERTKRAHAATNPLIAVPEPEPVDPQFVELFIEEAKEEIASIQQQLPAMGPKSHGFGVVGTHAPQLSYLEGQRPHGRRAGDRRIRLVDRESAESHHRQDAVAHAGNDGAAAQRASPPCRNWWSSWKPGGTTRCRSRR